MALTTPLPMLPNLTSLIVSVIFIYAFIIYPFLLHPLRKLPVAHWSVPFPWIGSIWILYQRYCRRNNAITYSAHLRSGQVVRLGYNEVSVSCVDNGIRTIYGGGWEKHEWYARQFAGYGVINMFSTVHHAPHSHKKRTMANIYSKSNLQVSPQVKVNSHLLLTERYLPLIQSIADSEQAANVYEMNNAFTMDFMSAYLFGIGRSTNFTHDLEKRREFMQLYHSRRNYEWHVSEVSPRLRRLIDRLHIPFVPKAVKQANEFLQNWNTNMCTSAEKYMLEHEKPDPGNLGDEPVVYKHFKTGIAKLREKDPEAGREILPDVFDPTPFIQLGDDFKTMSEQELKSEMYDHVSAGHETSAIGLTYLYWELSKNRPVQDALRRELQEMSPQIVWPLPPGTEMSQNDLPDPKTIDGLPYLQAVLMETLRLHAPIPGMEPRVSPDVVGGSTLGTYAGIPGGVRVSSMPYTLHRNPDVYPNPETFDPARWLIDDEARLKEMHRWFWAFGSGGRMCIGKHLAVQEMKLIVAAIYSNWVTEIVDDTGVEEIDAYTTRPKSNSLMLRFIHR